MRRWGCPGDSYVEQREAGLLGRATGDWKGRLMRCRGLRCSVVNKWADDKMSVVL